MKYITIIAFLLGNLISNTANAQNRLSTAVKKQLAVKQAKNYRLFTLSATRNPEIDREIRDVVYLDLDRSMLTQLMQGKDELITLYLPAHGGKEIPLQLMQYDFRSNDYRSVVHNRNGYETTGKINGLFYRGAITGAQSMAACSFYEDEMSAVFSDQEQGNYNLVPNPSDPGADGTHYLLFRENDILSERGKLCSMTEEATTLAPKGSTGADGVSRPYETVCNTVRVSAFADSILHRRAGGTIANTNKYLHSLFNTASALYANDNLFLSLSETIISTVDEDYDYSSSETVLDRFGNLVQSYTYNGNAAIFLTGSTSRLGGLAWLDALCAAPTPSGATFSGPYSMANTNMILSIPKLPLYSWDVQVVSHELGHTIGSPHTHNCSWPGGPIDNCVDPEGTCASTGTRPTRGGTIMSYCHQAPGIGINFANGFGPLPTALLKDKISTAACLLSGRPDSTLKAADIMITANAECNDGVWSHYFFDNNTSDLSDDILLLSIQKGSLDIGSISNPDFLVRMATNKYYGKDTAPDIGYPYATAKKWYETNRRWTIQLPAGKQPKTPVRLRYPFLEQDVRDIRGALALPGVKNEDLTFLKYATETPVKNISIATSADMRTITNSKTTASATTWNLGVSGGYNYVEVIADSGIYGGTLGYNKAGSGISEQAYNQKMIIRPNPATQRIMIEVPMPYTGEQQVLIFDQLGRLAVQSILSQPDMDISGLSPGVYTLKWISKEQGFSATGIFVKQ